MHRPADSDIVRPPASLPKKQYYPQFCQPDFAKQNIRDAFLTAQLSKSQYCFQKFRSPQYPGQPYGLPFFQNRQYFKLSYCFQDFRDPKLFQAA